MSIRARKILFCLYVGAPPPPSECKLTFPQMPYMHWDTDRQRDRFAKEIDSINLRQKEKRIKDAADAKFERQRLRTEISEKTPVKISDKKGPPPLHPFEIQAKAMRIEKKGLPVHEGRVRVKSKLGQYLIDAARLYEAMSAYRDRKLLRKYLAEDPPLHPRRTLDQAYYWTLNTTKTRDRDQVVYRGTTAKPEDFHTWDEKKGEWTAHKELLIPENETRNSCRSNIRKVSRVIMVDQLWMWILDQQTIITSFPKRYGVSKNDPSGVHKSIRTRLERGRQNQIRSVFDLALIIIDECSNTFFDRTKTPDRQPQVIDTFSDAIGNLVSGSELSSALKTSLSGHRQINKRLRLSGSGGGLSRPATCTGRKETPTPRSCTSACSTSTPRAGCSVRSRTSSRSWTS